MKRLSLQNTIINFDDESLKSRLLFDGCFNVKIKIANKILKCGLFESENVTIRLSGLINKLELYKCHNLNIITDNPIPLFDIQLCSNINITCESQTQLYIVSCMNIRYNGEMIPVGIWDINYLST